MTSTSYVLNVEGLTSVLMNSFWKREVGLATNMCKEEASLTVLLRLVNVAV